MMSKKRELDQPQKIFLMIFRSNILHWISLRLLLTFILFPVFPLSAETINEYEPSKFENFLFYFIFLPGLILFGAYVFIKVWNEVKPFEPLQELYRENREKNSELNSQNKNTNNSVEKSTKIRDDFFNDI